MSNASSGTQNRPLIGVTLGDPAGVGPEIVVKAVADAALHGIARILVFGTESVVRKAVDMSDSGLNVHPVVNPSEGVYAPGTLDLLAIDGPDLGALQPGVIQPDAGRAAFQYVRAAIEMAMRRDIDAIATAPVNKSSLRAGEVPYLDHTEMLAKLTGTPDPMTLFVLEKMRVFFLTRHVSLAEACRQINYDLVLAGVKRVHTELSSFGMKQARIAVAGLNPHNGEGGMFGSEEKLQIAPAVEEAKRQGINAFGPIPADSVFFLNRQGRYDAVLSLYHDQGHIATKTVDFERTISLTVGLPFVRSSVDHGTAFDIAWKGQASAVSMIEAVRVATEYAALLQR